MDDATDFEAIRRNLVNGEDEAAWLALRSYLERLLFERDGEDEWMDRVHEALQEVIATLLKYRSSGYLDKIRSLSSYCASIALRQRTERAMEDAERRYLERALTGDEEVPDPDPLRILLRAEFRLQIRQAFKELSPAQREVMVLQIREKLTHAQIARRLKKEGRPRSEASVSALIKRARKSIRKSLEDSSLRKDPTDRA